MKRIISVLLILIFSMQCFGTLPVSAQTDEKHFTVDGLLDDWYIDSWIDLSDPNYYYVEPTPIATDQVSWFDHPETFAQVYTAYDQEYIYVYVNVWDDAVSDQDSIEVWLDPDPNSKADTGMTLEYIVPDSAHKDSKQGDVQFCFMAKDKTLTQYADINKPGYGDTTFGDWISDPYNFHSFTFTNTPIQSPLVSEPLTLSSGYGLEVRFPRYEDDAAAYELIVTCYNQGEQLEDCYVLATQDFYFSREEQWKINYRDVNPFFSQPDKVRYGDVDDDQLITATDALLILKNVVGKESFTEEHALRADVSTNQKVDSEDALWILKHVVGKVLIFPVEQAEALYPRPNPVPDPLPT